MAQEKPKLIFGTATPGGGFPAYGWPYAEVLNAADATLGIEPINTKGSTENIVSLEQDKMDLGLVTGEVTYEAIKGIGGPPTKNIRIINATYSQAGMFMVPANSPYKTIADLKGKPIVWGAATSGFIVLARYVMDGMGLDFQKDFQPILLKSAGDGPPMVLDGRAAAMWGGGIGWPPFAAIANGPAGARFIGPSDEEIQRIMAKHSFLKAASIAANSSRSDRCGEFRRLMAVCAGTRVVAGRNSLQARPRLAPQRRRIRQAARTGGGIHAGQHPGGRAEPRSDTSRRVELSA